jgi:hypothetical protein
MPASGLFSVPNMTMPHAFSDHDAIEYLPFDELRTGPEFIEGKNGSALEFPFATQSLAGVGLETFAHMAWSLRESFAN